MGLAGELQEHIKEHEILGVKRFKIGNDTDYIIIDPTNHSVKIYVNGSKVEEWS